MVIPTVIYIFPASSPPSSEPLSEVEDFQASSRWSDGCSEGQNAQPDPPRRRQSGIIGPSSQVKDEEDTKSTPAADVDDGNEEHQSHYQVCCSCSSQNRKNLLRSSSRTTQTLRRREESLSTMSTDSIPVSRRKLSSTTSMRSVRAVAA